MPLNDKWLLNNSNGRIEWATLIVVPERRFTTGDSRAVLPRTVTMQEAIYNLQRTALLVSAVATRGENAMREALHDKLHEMHRKSLVPELEDIRTLLQRKNPIGCVLCGGGPSVLVIVNRKHKAIIFETLNAWAQDEPGTKVLDIEVDRHGVRELAL